MVKRFSTRSLIGVTGARALALTALSPFLLAALCGGDGDRGGAPVVVQSGRAECAPLFGTFPPGLDVLPSGRAVIATGGSQTLIPFELGGAPPLNVGVEAPPGLPVDSDGDGEFDLFYSDALGFGRATPRFARLHAVREDLVLVSASGYEEVLAYDPATSELSPIEVTNPVASDEHDPADHPFLPDAGETAARTAIATRVCVRPPDATDSAGNPIADLCDPGTPSFWTGYSAGVAVVDDVLVVTTSNLANSERGEFRPGTILLFSFDDSGDVPKLAPLVDAPARFTTHFNPTSVTPWTTANGRQLALVGNTGAIRLTSGPASVQTDAAIDVFDVATRRIAATVPMGPAALGFAGLEIDASSGLAVVGSPTQKQIYAVDLAALDDESLYAGDGPPVLLDGSDAVYPDARIFTGDTPFEIPLRADGADPAKCDGWTNVLIGPDRAGDSSRRDVYVNDQCDGTLTVLDVDLEAANELPLSPSRFSVERQLVVAAPNAPESAGLDQQPDRMVLGPAGETPGADGPALYYLLNIPNPALFCALDLTF